MVVSRFLRRHVTETLTKYDLATIQNANDLVSRGPVGFYFEELCSQLVQESFASLL